DGRGMLVEQAALSFKEWFGIIPTKEIKNKIKNERL
ncbi:MAG: shikimate dehydrogenase, partial [Pseudomonadota bacterium]|nr:shikimate dehydrogenase [Pseudomonadota bacterium]